MMNKFGFVAVAALVGTVWAENGDEGLVKEKDLRLVHKGPGNGHTLLLATGERFHVTVLIISHTHHLQHLAHPLVDFVGRHLLELEPEGDVVIDIEMREESIALKHSVERAFVRRKGGNVPAFEKHGALIRGEETGQNAESGGLAAAGRAEQGHKLPFTYIKADIVQDCLSTQLLTYVLQREDNI